MANTVRIIPKSGSLTFATGIANPSASIAGASTFNLQIDGSGVLALNTASVDLATFSPTNLSLDNDAVALIIPSASAQPPGAAIGTLYINTNNNFYNIYDIKKFSLNLEKGDPPQSPFPKKLGDLHLKT